LKDLGGHNSDVVFKRTVLFFHVLLDLY
jgi:hypothetical protein